MRDKNMEKKNKDKEYKDLKNTKGIVFGDFNGKELENEEHYKIPEFVYQEIYGALYKYSKQYNRILCLSDLHIPFALPIDRFKDYAGYVDILVLNGDLVDNRAISKFDKLNRHDPVEDLVIAWNYLNELIRTIKPKEVIVIDGNHDVRLASYVANKIDTQIGNLIPSSSNEYLFEDGFTVYDKENGTKKRYCGLREMFNLGDILVDINYVHNWYAKVGNVIFAHPSAFSSMPMKTAEKALGWFRNELNCSIDAVVLAHTHRTGQYKIGNTYLFEQGAFCDTDKMKYGQTKLVNSQKQGYMYICEDLQGNYINDYSKLYCLN